MYRSLITFFSAGFYSVSMDSASFFDLQNSKPQKNSKNLHSSIFREKKTNSNDKLEWGWMFFLLSQLFIGLLNSLSVIQMTGKNCINHKFSRKERWVNWNYSHISGCVVYINCARSVNPGISTNLKITPINRFNSCCAALRCAAMYSVSGFFVNLILISDIKKTTNISVWFYELISLVIAKKHSQMYISYCLRVFHNTN